MSLLKCNRNLDDHCCFLKGKTCIYLRENSDDPRWTCTLREELGSWDKVHKDVRYLKDVKPTWGELNIADCGNYTCENCIDGNS